MPIMVGPSRTIRCAWYPREGKGIFKWGFLGTRWQFLLWSSETRPRTESDLEVTWEPGTKVIQVDVSEEHCGHEGKGRQGRSGS